MAGDVVSGLAAFLAGAVLWTLAEYLLHRFAMHELRGKGIMSREHLEHHVLATWVLTPRLALSWLGIILVGSAVWGPLGWFLGGPAVGVGLGLGWVAMYGFYEWTHRAAHLWGPRGRYTTWLRRHHFHHHFGHPMTNHGVTTNVWDRLFGTLEVPEQVRVPRRLVLPWLVDGEGRVLPEYAEDYVLVGAADVTERTAAIDRARAFASMAPVD